MYGKSFESQYDGSLVGAGFHVWAVWNYVITKTHFGVIELNPRLLAFTLAGTDPKGEKLVRQAIDFLSSPDPESRTKTEQGRRLVREGQFQYRVVNWEVYQGIKSELALKEYNRLKQAEHRAKKKAGVGRSKPTAGEAAYVKALESEGQAAADAVVDSQFASQSPFEAMGGEGDGIE